MQTAPEIVELDGQSFAVRFEGSGAVVCPQGGGETVRFEPWRFAQHVAALDRHAITEGDKLRFDTAGFAAEVLAASGMTDVASERWTPVALWWAAGAPIDGQRRPRFNGEWLEAHHARIRVRPWTFVERSRAVSASITTHDDGSQVFSLERYLHALAAASVVEADPPALSYDQMDGLAAALVDALVAINSEGGRPEDALLDAGDGESQALAQLTLRLCKALGWTPSQVWAAPATEIDRLLKLMAITEGNNASKPRRRAPSLADYPDAVVIRLEDG